MRWRRVFDVRERSLAVRIERAVCLGKCNDGPNLRFVGGEFQQNLSMDDVPTLLNEFEERAGKNDAGAMLYAGA